MEDVMFVLELIGAAAFAVSGAMVAIEKKADIFGVLFLAVTTALGGGVIRDVLIGRIPPVMFVSYWYLLISVVAALAVFIDAYLRSEKYKLHLDKLDAVNNVFDAIGLAVFTVSGMNAAMPVSDNVILVLFVGMCTGVGGGIIIDGKIYTGFNHAAGEMGHITIRAGGEPCACGRKGCLEAYASATALIRESKRAFQEHPDCMIRTLCDGDLNKINAKTPFDAKRAGDKIGAEIVDIITNFKA